MFPYYGSKRRLAGRYPEPVLGTIIEPFAGSAAYALHWPEREVVLIDRDPDVCRLWRYLIAADPERIMALPLLGTGDNVDVPAGLTDDERLLLGFFNGWNRPTVRRNVVQGAKWADQRAKIADTVQRIRHWQIIEGDHTEAPDVRATWFIDPPYQGAGGAHYRHGNNGIDYDALGAWCRSRRGQVIVCEYGTADWLPFRHLAWQSSQHNALQSEVVWLSGTQPRGTIGQALTGRRGGTA